MLVARSTLDTLTSMLVAHTYLPRLRARTYTFNLLMPRLRVFGTKNLPSLRVFVAKNHALRKWNLNIRGTFFNETGAQNSLFDDMGQCR